jgi:RimJ/RimL family protein N-acetyltransferase
MPPRIETARLILRPFTPDDLDEAYEVFESHPDVWKYDPGHQRTREQRAVITMKYANSNLVDGEGNLAVTLKDKGVLIGYVGLQLYILPTEPIAIPEVELFYKLGRPWWGQGYATEACNAMLKFSFEELHLGRIVTVVSKDNESSIRLMKKLGMRIGKAPASWPNDLMGILENPAIQNMNTFKG